MIYIQAHGCAGFGFSEDAGGHDVTTARVDVYEHLIIITTTTTTTTTTLILISSFASTFFCIQVLKQSIL